MGLNWLKYQHGFIALTYNTSDQNVLINNCKFACVKQTVLCVECILKSPIGYTLGIAGHMVLFSFGLSTHWEVWDKCT